MTSYQSSMATQSFIRIWRVRMALAFLTVSVFAAFVASIAMGPVSSNVNDLLLLFHSYIGGEPVVSSSIQQVIEMIRLPRAFLGLLVGAALAISGATIQGVFRNPLADPTLIGVSGGAALSAVAMVVFGHTLMTYLPVWLHDYALLTAAFLGGLVVTLLVAKIATSPLGMSISTLLLAGIAISIITMSGVGIMTYIADDTQLRTLTFWQMGSLGGATWNVVIAASVFIVPSCFLMITRASSLNALLLGEAEAGHLGIQVQRVRRQLILLSAMAVGASVAVSGMIGFVGLVIPHLIRMTLGPDHRYLLLASGLAGALFLMIADIIARTLLTPAELPIGLVTAVIGGPFFIGLIIARGRHGVL